MSFNTSAAMTGLAVSNALQLLLFTQWLFRVASETNATMASVSSVVYFTDNSPREKAAVIKDSRPRSGWPDNGNIEFKNVVLRYEYGFNVLKSVSFCISAREKVGIVGRSGSGKTSLLVALMRLTEISSGSILIDSLDISTIGLRDLREKVAVVPQEPVLLTGTIRSNLDPLGLKTDAQIWKSLRNVHLFAKINEMEMMLETRIVDNGKAFSIAERQLFCIARYRSNA